MNAVPPFTEKLCSNSSEKRRCLMSRSGTKLTLDKVVNTKCTLMEHVASDEKAELTTFITETIWEALPANRAALLPAHIILDVVKSGLICGGSSVTLQYYDVETESTAKDIKIGNRLPTVYADCRLGPAKAKILFVVLVEGEDEAY